MWLFKILILLNSISSALNYEYNKDIKKYYSLSAILESPDAMWEKCLDNSFLEFYTAPIFQVTDKFQVHQPGCDHGDTHIYSATFIFLSIYIYLSSENLGHVFFNQIFVLTLASYQIAMSR